MVNLQHQAKRFFLAAAGGMAIVLAGCAGMSTNKNVLVTLSGADEVPPIITVASGTGSFVVGADKSVSGGISTTGIVGIAAHIHTGAAGANGPIAIAMVKDGERGWLIPAGSKFTDAQYAAYLAGGTYVNVHSAANKGGEIRAQLRP